MPVPYNKVRLSGTMPGGEVWSINPCFGRADGSAVDTFAELQAWAENIADGMPTDVIGPVMREVMSSAVRLTQVRTEFYGADGTLNDVAEVQLTTPVTTTFAPNKPFQSAIVLSLRSARPGRSFRGRLYWPALNVALSTTTLRVTPLIANGLAADAVELLGDIAAAGQGSAVLQPIIVSQTLGINTPITRVEVGDIIDVQRRRRDSLEETYVSAPLVSA